MFPSRCRTMKIALIGYGKMGREVEAAALARNYVIAARIDPVSAEASASNISEEALKNADVCIEFSEPSAALKNIEHPEASFVNNLVASRILDDEVRSLRNREYHVIRADGTDVEVVGDATRLHAILTEELRLQVSAEEAERLFADCRPQ